MTRSEFWRAVDEVYGSAYGRSLAQDLVLERFHAPAAEALEAGQEPLTVWFELLEQSGKSVADWGFLHRLDAAQKKTRRP